MQLVLIKYLLIDKSVLKHKTRLSSCFCDTEFAVFEDIQKFPWENLYGICTEGCASYNWGYKLWIGIYTLCPVYNTVGELTNNIKFYIHYEK